jgi:hypothetical protein
MLQQIPDKLTVPTSLSASVQSGGSMSIGLWGFYVAATDIFAIGALSALATATTTSGNQTIELTWTESIKTGVAGYVVFAYPPSGTYLSFYVDGFDTTTVTITANPASQQFLQPSSDETQKMMFRIATSSYDMTTEIQPLPSGPVRGNTIVESTILGEPVTPNGGGHFTASGGVNSSSDGPLPQIIEFGQHLILALGNTSGPQTWNGSGGTSGLANNFSLSFPAWTASTIYEQGSIITATVSGTAYFFQQTQVGSPESGSGSAPTFPAGLNQQVAEPTGPIWNNIGTAAVPAPRAAAHAISHAGYLWLWNTQTAPTSDGLDGPSVLKMSNLGDENSWNPLCTATVGQEDDQQGMGMASFSVSEAGIAPQLTLVLFKEFSTYVVTGILPNATIVQAQTSLGCIAPRSIQFIPNYGIIRLTHEGVAIFDGISDQIVGDAVRPFLLQSPTAEDPTAGGIGAPNPQVLSLSHSFQVANPPMYGLVIAPYGGTANELTFTRVLLFDLENGAWWVVDMPFSVYAAFQSRQGAIYSTAVEALTMLGGVSDGVVRDFMDTNTVNATEWDNGDPISWTVYLPWLFGDGGVQRIYVRSLIVKGVYPNAGVSPYPRPSVSATVNVFGGTQQQRGGRYVPAINNVPAQIYNMQPAGSQGTNGNFEAKIDIGLTGSDFQAILSGTGVVQINSLEWMAQERAPGKPKSVMVG